MRKTTREFCKLPSNTKLLAFYHPFCDSGGGGERVLWKMLHSLNELNKLKAINVSVVIYAAQGNKTGDEILKSACERFGIDVGKSMPVHFIFIPTNLITLLKPEAWPRFTMIGQSIGSIMVAWNGLKGSTPDT
jgi:alpha-1,2-mannosyltransferase